MYYLFCVLYFKIAEKASKDSFVHSLSLSFPSSPSPSRLLYRVEMSKEGRTTTAMAKSTDDNEGHVNINRSVVRKSDISNISNMSDVSEKSISRECENKEN